MQRQTPQIDRWAGEFGREYTDRNAMSAEEMDAQFRARFGISRTDMNQRFLSMLDPETARVLEVGSNIGNQLLCLQRMGFKHLYGIELQPYAVELSKRRTQNINLIQGSGFDIPFKDGFFDLVFTAGVLIHIAPRDLPDVMREVHRCTRAFIWGMEYYAPKCTEVNYRGHEDLLWKDDFARVYREVLPDLHLVKEEHYKFLDSDNVNTMFLLRKNVSNG